MKTEIKKTEYTIDAQGRKLGRVASMTASLLMGKNRQDFSRNRLFLNVVRVINASKIEISDKKMHQKLYSSYSGYPGGLKKSNMVNVISKKGIKEVLKIAVRGMLPKNKLRDKMIKNLIVSE